jgi:hypothetical protein
MPQFKKSTGLTASERYLAELCEKSFLSLRGIGVRVDLIRRANSILAPCRGGRLKICCTQGRVGSSLTGPQSPRRVTCYASQDSARWWSQPQQSDSAGGNRAVAARRLRRDRESLRHPQNGKPNIIRELEPFSEPELLTEVLEQPAKSSKPSNRLNANRECMETSL